MNLLTASIAELNSQRAANNYAAASTVNWERKARLCVASDRIDNEIRVRLRGGHGKHAFY